MDKLVFERVDQDSDHEYRATVPGQLLILAQKEDISLPIEDDMNIFIRLSTTAWLNNRDALSMGIVGSIQNEKFEYNAKYYVFYARKASPPYMFAIKAPE